jgi:hypothetical protein
VAELDFFLARANDIHDLNHKRTKKKTRIL